MRLNKLVEIEAMNRWRLVDFMVDDEFIDERDPCDEERMGC